LVRDRAIAGHWGCAGALDLNKIGPILVKSAEKIVFDPQFAAFWRWRHRRSPEEIQSAAPS
jgi:hypothetical protein